MEQRRQECSEVVEAHQILAAMGTQFYWKCRGLDIPKGTADVIVCKGFMGNVALKILKGSPRWQLIGQRCVCPKVSSAWIEHAVQRTRQLQSMTDWKQYGGAPLLGFSSLAIKAHGRSNSRAIRNAVKVAAKAVEGGLVERIHEQLAKVLNSVLGSKSTDFIDAPLILSNLGSE